MQALEEVAILAGMTDALEGKPSNAKLKLLIPTRDSALWIGEFLSFFRRLGVEPFYVVDSRSRDGTRAVLQGMNADFVEYAPSADFPEAGMIEYGSRRSGGRWILRLDDDEFPTRALLDWAQATATHSLNQLWFVSRRELFRYNGEIFYSRAPARYSHRENPHYLQPQARLHHVDRNTYIERIHTTGVEHPTFYSFAPQTAFIAHCRCLLRSSEERLQRLKKYESIEEFSSWKLADEYLPEIFNLEHHRPANDGLKEFEELFSRLPLIGGRMQFKLCSSDQEIAMRKLAELQADLSRARRIHKSHVHDANSLRFLLHLPRRLWRPLAEFLCTFGIKRLGSAIWNFHALYGKDAQLSPRKSRHGAGDTKLAALAADRTKAP